MMITHFLQNFRNNDVPRIDRKLKKPLFLKLVYLSPQLIVCIIIAHTLKGTSLNFLINLLGAQKVHLVLL